MEKEILSMEEAASLFGVSTKTFIKLLKEEDIPARKIGREWRFSRNALIHWLSSGSSQNYSASDSDNRQYFDKVAPQWETISQNYYDHSIVNKLIQSDILNKGQKVVDFGSGDGYVSRNIAAYVNEVIAVDTSPGMLIQLQEKAKAQKIQNITVIRNDETEVPLDDNSIDLICCSMVLHHIEKPSKVLAEFFRILKSSGKVFIADFVTHQDKKMEEDMFDLWMGFDPQKVKEWLEKAGFRSVEIQIVNEQDLEMALSDTENDKSSKNNTASKKIFLIFAQKEPV